MTGKNGKIGKWQIEWTIIVLILFSKESMNETKGGMQISWEIRNLINGIQQCICLSQSQNQQRVTF